MAMANQPSENSRRITYVEDRDVYAALQERAKKDGVSVGQLIRAAVARFLDRSKTEMEIKMRPTHWVEPEAETKAPARKSKKK
jgi:hypothetical protein